jgi:hypothetical protein
MTALGIYLLISLFFVVGGMIEFAILLFLLRRSENSSYGKEISNNFANKIDARNENEYNDDRRNARNSNSSTAAFKNDSFEFIICARKIDFIATIVFPITYSVFNIIYWTHYL